MSNLLRKVSVALAIKVVSAPLSFVMLLTISTATSLAEFGLFSFAFALATFLSKVAAVGQPQLLLRELSALEPENEAVRAGVTVFGYGVTLGVGVTIALVLAGVGIALGQTTLIAACALVPLLALSELQTSILRAHGSVINAMALREVVWRVMVIAVVFGLALLDGPQNADFVIMLVSILLLVAILMQALSHPATHFLAFAGKPRQYEREKWLQSTGYFWATSVIIAAAPQLAVVIVGLFAPITEIGPFFAAQKAAQLLEVMLVATNVIATPLLARHFAKGEIGAVQKICTYSVMASSGSALVGLLAYVFFGQALLAYFGAGFQDAYPQLLIMSAAYFLTAIFGQNGQLLQMSGNEKNFTRIMAISNATGLTFSVVLSYFYSSLGGALALLLSFAVWNIWAWQFAWRKCGVDTSIFSVIKLLRSSR